MKFYSSLVFLVLMSFVVASGQQVKTVRQTVTTITKGKTVSVETRQVRVVTRPAPTKSPANTSTAPLLTVPGKAARTAGAKKAHPNLVPGYPNATISSQSFGSTAVGGTSATITLTYPYPAGVNEQTLSFGAGSNGFFGQATCNYPQPCTAPLAFQPVYPGLTTNSVISKDQNGNVIYETLLYATGTSPQFGFDLGGLSVNTGVATQPESIAVGPDGNLYLTDASEKVVYRFGPGFSNREQLEIEIGNPGGIAVDGGNTIYVADKTNNVVVAYNDALEAEVNLTTSQLSNPSGVAVDGTGAVYIADTGNGRIIKLDNHGNETTVASGISSPTSLAVDGAGDLFYVDTSNGGEVTELPVAGGNPVTIQTGLGSLNDIAVDAAGRLYISTPNGDTLIGPDGSVVGYGGGSNYGMAVDPAGNIYTSQPQSGSVAETNRSVSNFILSTMVDTTVMGGDTISNTGNTTLTLSNIAITGGTVFTDDSGDQCTAGLTLAPGITCNTLVDFTPTAAQNYTESYTVMSNSLNVTTSSNVDTLYGNGVGVPTSTALSISPSPATPGQAVTFTATVNQQGETELPGPTGSVNFLDGTTMLGSGTLSGNTAVYSNANLAGGTHSITAMYPGDTYNAASTSTAQSLLVTTGIASATTLSSTPSSPRAGQVVTFTVGVTGDADAYPTGTVTLSNNAVTPSTVVGTVTLNGNGQGTFATLKLAAGSYSVVANYSGDANFGTSSSAVDSFTVSPAITTTTTLTVSAATVAYETPVTLSATVQGGDSNLSFGQVYFCDTSATQCNLFSNLGIVQLPFSTGGAGVLKLAPGTIGVHHFTATFVSVDGYLASTSAAQPVTVTGTYSTSATITSSGTGGSYSLTGTVVGLGTRTVGPTGTVSFLDTSNSNASLGSGMLGASTLGFGLAQPSGSPVGVGAAPYGVATGDFNGDGFQDVVVENYESDTVSVLLGNGDGTFQPQVTYAVGVEPERVLVADLNGDGNLDLIVANTGSSTISVLLGNGDGTFQAQVTYQCGSPVGLGVMDINHDGIPDVVAGDYYDNTISVLLGNGDGTLQAAVTYATGSTPQTVAEGDFNGDGNIDVVVGNEGGATVGIFLGNGDGTLQTMVTYPVGNLPMGVQVGDFNNDGKQDLAVSNQSDGTISVLLGNGDGTFKTQVTYPVGVQPVGLAIADFNGDGIEDITVGNTGQASLTQSVLLGNGDGTFQPQVTFPAGNFPYGVAVGDFNGDGLPDMAVANFNDGTATIFLSQVTQTAAASTTVTVTGGTDTEHDVEASYPGDANFKASVSQTTPLFGSGTTLAATTTSLTSTPAAPTAGQTITFTVLVSPTTGNDSVPSGTVTLMNTAVTPATTVGTITLNGNGGGTFSTSSLAQGTYSISAVYSGDTNFATSTSSADMFTVSPAVPAVATTTSLSTSASPSAYEKPITLTASVVTVDDVTVTAGQVVFCDVTAAPASKCTVSSSAMVGIAQLTANNNGAAILKFAPGTLGAHNYKAVFLGTPAYSTSTSAAQAVTVTGTYPTTTTIASTGSAGSYSLTGTVVGLGAVSPTETGSVSFIDASNANAVLGTASLGTGVAGFTEAQATGSPVGTGAGPTESVAGDFNGDGFEDLAVANFGGATVGILLGNGDGTFQPQVTYTTGNGPYSVQVADFNGDGHLDLVVANQYDNTVGILLGNGDGTFQAQVTYAVGQTPISIGVMDLNHDGIADLVVGSDGSNTVSVLLGKGDGTFNAAVSYTAGNEPNGIAEGDFNGDGNIDLAVANYSDDTVSVLLGKGDGTFQTQVTYPVGGAPNTIQVGDLKGNGVLDIAVTNLGDSTVSVLLGNGDGTFQSQVTYAAGGEPGGVVLADFNGDGVPDIAVESSSDDTVSVLLGNGDGTFQTQTTYPAGPHPNFLTEADFNGDGHPDLAVADYTSAAAVILLSQVTLTAETPATTVLIGGGADSTHNVKASYPGDTMYSASVSQPTALQGGAATVASTTTLGIAPAAPTLGQSVTFTASVAGATQVTPVATGTVTLMNTAVTPATLLGTITLGATGAGTFSTATLAAGTYNVVAAYSGDTTYLASMSTAHTLVVSLATQTIAFGALANQTYGVAPLTLAATASSGLPVTFAATGPVTVNGATLTITGAGTVTVTASQAGNAAYAAATPVAQSFTVAQSVLAATANNLSRSYGTANPALTYAVTGFVNGDTAAVVGGSATLSTTATTASDAGTYPIAFATKTLTATNYSFNYVAGTLTILGNVAQTITFPAIPNHTLGDAPFTLSATASSGLAVSYAVTAGPATVAGSTVTLTGSGTVTIQASQAGNLDYAAATPVSQSFKVAGVPAPTLASISPAGAVAGSATTTVTLTGANFTATDLVEIGEGTLTTTFVNATTMTAVIPANFLTEAGTLPISITDTATQESSGVVNFVVSVAPVVVFSGPSTTTSDAQPMVTFQLKQPYAVPINCLLTLTFVPSTAAGIVDPAVQFSTGGTTLNFTIPAGSTTTPPVEFQTGTVAGTATVTLTILTTDGVNVTPPSVAPVVVSLPATVPQIASATVARTGAGTASVLTVTVQGFSNTREVQTAIFHFTPVPGTTLSDSDVTINVSDIFGEWFGSDASTQYGSTFTYTQPFNLNSDPSTIQNVTVTLVNGVGNSVAQTTE